MTMWSRPLTNDLASEQGQSPDSTTIQTRSDQSSDSEDKEAKQKSHDPKELYYEFFH